MSLCGSERSRDRHIASLALAIAGAIAACRGRDDRPIDAAAVVIPIDAAPIDAAPDAAIVRLPIATRLVAAGDFTCAVMSDLTLRCWGGNSHGQLGNASTSDAATPATPVIHAVKDLQLADATACALLDDGSVACWGQIGWNGHPQDTLRPSSVTGVTGVTQIFVLDRRACARVANSSLVCWGNVDARGHFAAGPTNRAPTAVVGLDHIAGMTADAAFSDDGRMWTWAADGAPRRLDTGAPRSGHEPAASDDTAVEQIAERDGTVCGRLHNGRVMCAASQRCGPRHTSTPPTATPPSTRSGKPTNAAAAHKAAKPTAPTKPTRPTQANKPGKPADAAAGGEPAIALGFPAAHELAFGVGFCVVTTTHKLQCSDGCRRIDPPRLAHVDRAVGRCLQLTSGAITCFDGRTPTVAAGIAHATSLVAGRAHACAIAGDRIACWGANDHAQLGGFAITR